MTNRASLRLTVAVSTIALSTVLGSPAYAEAAAPIAAQPSQAGPECTPDSAPSTCVASDEKAAATNASERDKGEIVVTGSRIRRPNLNSPVPITSITAEELAMTGDVNIGDRLNDLPSLRSTFSQANSTRFIGTAGVNSLDLRGLGVERTLVLVNGRRHITYTPGDYLVDTNTIPTDLIDRVDIVTGGESAVYGSDAVAGVVNFVLKKNYDGFRVRAQTGLSSRGDRAVNFISLTAGQNFLDNRANVAVNLEYVDADALYFKQRPSLTGAFDGRCQFNLAEPTAGEPRSGDGVPDNQFFCGVRNQAISNGGTITANASVAQCQSAAFGPAGVNAALGAQRCLNPGTPLGAPRFLNFSRDGTLCEEIPALDFRPFGSGNYIHNPSSACAPGATLRDTGQLAPGLKRYSGNLLAHFDISDAFKPFVEAKFVRVDALQEGQPSFFQSTFPGFFGSGVGIRCDNPFLTAQNITALQTIGRCPGGATSSTMLPLARFDVDFGGRQEKIRRDTYRIVGGIQGDFNEDWNYEISVNYGHLKSRQREFNDLRIFDLNGNDAGFLLATDAVRDPNTGQIVCRVNSTSLVQDPLGTANDDPACVPINVLGEGQPSQAALNYVNTTSFVDSTASELDVLAFVNGDSSQLFSLPGGPISFSIGVEHREERAHQIADPLSAAGGTFFNAFQEFDPPAFKVNEIFGEVELPIVRDQPLFHELTVSGAMRYSDYNTAANHTLAWNVNGVWAPVRDLRLRGNYSKSVRVPTQSDLFTPPTQNFAFLNDPCDTLFINTGSTLRAGNCLAAGVPVGFVNTPARTQTLEIVSSGNPFLQEETGKSLTLGGVLTPRWVPGLSISVDYYRIRVKNLIATLGGQTILNQCFDLPQPNQFCALLFPRNPDSTFPSPTLISGGVNFAKQEADGIDMELAYRKTFSNGHRLNLHGVATYVLKRNNFTDPLNSTIADRQLSELGDAQWNANMNIGYGIGIFDLSYSLNYIGRQTVGTYESQHSFAGNPPQNADQFSKVWYPAVLYHAARLDLKIPTRDSNRKFDLYFGIDNLFDKKPPLGLLGTGGGDPFDAIGRYFYGGVTVDL
ncbi:MAG TPA: TonB-dependent receptor [Sphingomicrobium sp.]|nr:TonB-dependent receptor [Sphingomicrobium sp.]